MKESLVIALAMALLPLFSYADTKGIDGLRQFNCNIVSQSGEIEQLVPIEKTILAQSTEQATALYLVHIDANMVSKRVVVSYKVDRPYGIEHDALKEVSCKLMK